MHDLACLNKTIIAEVVRCGTYLLKIIGEWRTHVSSNNPCHTEAD